MPSTASSINRDPSLGGPLPSASFVASAAASSTNRSGVKNSSSIASYALLITALGKRTGMSSMQVERAVGLSAITGTSIVVLRFLLYAFRSVRGSDNINNIEDEISDCTTDDAIARRTRTTSNSLLGIFRRTLRRILLDEPTAIANGASTHEDVTDGPLVTHQGSCHCESIQFTVLAPRSLAAQDGPGKIQFRHTQVRASNFQVYAGHEWLKTYYVVFRDSGKKGAHAFCERCGVHVLYAPSKSTPYLSINVRCIRDEGTHKIRLTSRKDGISDGIPVEGQFYNINSDQLSTISEVTQPFNFQMNNANNQHRTIQYPNNNQRMSDMSLVSSSTGPFEENAIEVPIKQFYATTTPSKKNERRRSYQQDPMTLATSTTTTASLTTIEADSSSSLYKGQISELEMMVPTNSIREGGASLGGIDDLSFTGESVSLMDEASVTSTPISMRRKSSLRVSTGRLGERGGNPPLHTTVTSPETRNKMKYFMSKYNKEAKTGNK
mmetsp:Transcript_10239/g.11763  ORF Transcript_10239/g.11763 Transcript_10239/m.11763 type:complete len:495 (+) Transcript_10239:117-1601(+)